MFTHARNISLFYAMSLATSVARTVYTFYTPEGKEIPSRDVFERCVGWPILHAGRPRVLEWREGRHTDS